MYNDTYRLIIEKSEVKKITFTYTVFFLFVRKGLIPPKTPVGRDGLFPPDGRGWNWGACCKNVS
jgi:hypothetical protein